MQRVHGVRRVDGADGGHQCLRGHLTAVDAGPLGDRLGAPIEVGVELLEVEQVDELSVGLIEPLPSTLVRRCLPGPQHGLLRHGGDEAAAGLEDPGEHRPRPFAVAGECWS